MKDTGKYVPLNDLIRDKDTQWTFVTVGRDYESIAKAGVVMWCVENMEGRWTMMGGNKFGFEDEGDALPFKLQFDVME